MKEPKVYVDVHERDSGLLDALITMGLVAEEKHMESGDVVIYYQAKSVGIELKRVQDYTNSMKEGRLKDQICRLYDNYDWPVLIVEAWKPWVRDDDTGETISEKVRKYRMSLRTLNRRLTVYETDNQEQTVNIIEEIVRDLKAGKLFVMRRPVIVEPELSQPMKVICSLPNVKQVIGERILGKYGSVSKALDDIDNWTDLDGIGKVTLGKIKDVLMGSA